MRYLEKMGVELNPVTSGPVVNESLENKISPGSICLRKMYCMCMIWWIFVSQEAAAAGRFAADFIRNKKILPKRIRREKRYETVMRSVLFLTAVSAIPFPLFIRPEYMEESLTIRFRVGRVYGDCYVCVYF